MTNKGQATIEAIVIGVILILSLSFCLRYALSMQQNILVDELIEQTLICQFEKKYNCQQTLRTRLQSLQFRNIMIRTENQNNKFTLYLSALSSFEHIYEKESELVLDLNFTP